MEEIQRKETINVQRYISVDYQEFDTMEECLVHEKEIGWTKLNTLAGNDAIFAA